MPVFETESSSPISPEEIFDFIVDLSQWPSFKGFGPLPGIVRAEVEDGSPMRAGARVRVLNTDQSVHHERILSFERGRLLEIQMELGPPASRVMRGIRETIRLEPTSTGTRITRRFETEARSLFTAPMTWLFGKILLRQAVIRHNLAVEALVSRPA